MKKIYCIHVTEFDEICGNRDLEILHTTNKKRLTDLCLKFNKKNRDQSFTFQVREIIPAYDLTKQQIIDGIESIGFLGCEL